MLGIKLPVFDKGRSLTWTRVAMLLLAAAPVHSSVAAAPSLTTYTWKEKDGSMSGSFSDPDHWSPTGEPGALSSAKINATGATITFPAGEYDTLASLLFNVNGNGTLTWNGADTVFRQASSATDNYSEEPFGLRCHNSHFFNLQTYNTAAATHYKTAISTISNGVFRLTRPSSGEVAVRLDFDSGSYNFYDADGETACSDRVMMISRNNITDGSFEYNFHPGTKFRYPCFKVLSNHPGGRSSTFNFLGGTHEILGTLDIPTTEAYTSYDSATVFNITNGASLSVYGNAQFGHKAVSPYNNNGDYAMGRQYRITVAGGGSLTFGGKFTHATCGRLEMAVGDGGSLAFNGSEAKIGGQNSTGVVTVARGGRISGNLALGCGASGYAELMVDGGTAEFAALEIGKDALADTSVVVTNVAQVSSATLNLCKGALDLPSGIAWTNSGTARIGYEIGAKAHMTVREGATFRVLRQLDVGSGNGEGTLDILGGTVWQRDPNDNNVYTYIANKAASTGTVNLVSGLFKVRGLYCGQRGLGVFNILGGKFESDFVYFPYSAASDAQAEVNISGGEFYVTDSLGIGFSGAAEMNVSGGEVSANYIFLGQGATSVQDDWAVLRQTGGYIKTRVSYYDATTGVKLADANGRNSKLILDGGRLCTYHIFGNKSRAAGGTGYAALSANGGTVETPFAINAALIEKLDEAKLGARGLTVKSDHACTIPQDFTDADDAAGEGLLALTGVGLKTITATNSTVSRLDVVGGTVLFSTNALGMQAVQHSAITVTNNATLSLEGGQTSLTLRSLVLGNATSVGRLKLDVGDMVRVEGSLTVNSGLLQVSDGFEVGNEYGVVELLGAEDRSAELEAALALLHVDSSVSGRGYVLRAEYDQATGKTTAKLAVSELQESGTKSWRGPGSDWETDANWSDGAPGMADVAVFDSGTAPAAVEIAGQRQVGGIVFNASQDYTLVGGGLSIQPIDETRIDATQGVHSVESRLWLPDGIPVTVASGAGLTLGGVAIGGELVKQGAGRLAVTNIANGFGGFTVTGGTFAVTSPAALGGAASVTMNVGALELGGEAGADTRYAAQITLDNPVMTNALMLRVSQDVTLGSWAVLSGLPYKDGPGRLTLEATSSSKVLSVGDGDSADWAPLYNNKGGLVSYDADGLVTDSTVLAGLTVAEGELMLRGTSDNAVFIARHYMTVGVPGTSASAAPALTVDHAKLDNKQDSRHLIVGGGLKADNSSLTDIYLTATNGAEVSCNTLYVARAATLPGVTHHIRIDASTLASSYMTHANCNVGEGSLSEFTFGNGSKFYVGSALNLPNRSTFAFDASVMAKNANLDLAALTYKKNLSFASYPRAGGEFVFRNGSTLYLDCGAIDLNPSQADPTTLTFDNSEWVPVKNADCTFAYSSPEKIEIRTANTGLLLDVPASRTWTMGEAVTGTGGLVKRGAGTLVFDTHKVVHNSAVVNWANATTTLDFTGTLAVESGKVVVRNGAAASGAKFALSSGTELDLDGGAISIGAISGAGTVKNGTVTGTIPLTLNNDWTTAEEPVVFDADTVTFGWTTVDLGRTAENPVAQPFGTVVVGRYSGSTPPDVSRWRVKGAGRQGVGGEFTAEAGEIRMRLCFKGLIISFR